MYPTSQHAMYVNLPFPARLNLIRPSSEPRHRSFTVPIKCPQMCAAHLVRHTESLIRGGKMSALVLLVLSRTLCVWAAHGAVELQDAISLNEMFREVEKLMEDTQHLLQEAVDQITTESEKSTLSSLDETNKTMMDGDRAVQLLYTADKECMVDEDCGLLKYCLYEIENSKCLPCIQTDMPCTKDEECCSDQMCVWGQCTVNATKGTEGSICQGQRDCRPDLCCAFQRELLFPVCNPKPEKGESCLSHPNLLMDMLAWDQEGPRDHCPCADNLQCQPHGQRSVCGE